jgi:hypothetical protein
MATYGVRPGRPTYRPKITYRLRTSIRFLLHARAIISVSNLPPADKIHTLIVRRTRPLLRIERTPENFELCFARRLKKKVVTRCAYRGTGFFASLDERALLASPSKFTLIDNGTLETGCFLSRLPELLSGLMWDNR